MQDASDESDRNLWSQIAPKSAFVHVASLGSRRSRYTFLTLAAVVVFVFSFTQLREWPIHQTITIKEFLEEKPLKDLTYPPLLGLRTLPSALWFPSQGTIFEPQVASYNVHPANELRPRTPLFIGFTRNNRLLIQTVLGYIAAGWPREDIIVVDNSGTFDANNEGLLSEDNPFFLNYPLLRSRYGVSVLQTPTLLSFAQLQNFFLRTAIAQKWTFFFWSHMDVAIISDEEAVPYTPLYRQMLNILNESGLYSQADGSHQNRTTEERWGLKFFHYDWLTLVNVEAWREVGQWDTFIPYYGTDCDAYARLALHGWTRPNAKWAGALFDVADDMQNPESDFFPAYASEQPNSPRYKTLRATLQKMQDEKTSDAHRNRLSWKNKYKGGEGEPWTYDITGFAKMWTATSESGIRLAKEKWGLEEWECRLEDVRKLEHQFQAWKKKDN